MVGSKKYYTHQDVFHIAIQVLNEHFPNERFDLTLLTPFAYKVIGKKYALATTIQQKIETVEPFIKPNIWLRWVNYGLALNYIAYVTAFPICVLKGAIIHEILHIKLGDGKHSKAFQAEEIKYSDAILACRFLDELRGRNLIRLNTRVYQDWQEFMNNRRVQTEWDDKWKLRSVSYTKEDINQSMLSNFAGKGFAVGVGKE